MPPSLTNHRAMKDEMPASFLAGGLDFDLNNLLAISSGRLFMDLTPCSHPGCVARHDPD